jgi:hypothetical protein
VPLSLLVSKHLAVFASISQTFFTLKDPAILRALLTESKGSVKEKKECHSKSAVSHPLVNNFAKVCNTNKSLCHRHMEVFMLDGSYAARLSTCQIF